MPRKAKIEDPKQNPGRNELCHCGSGKKYKKCCFDKDSEKRHSYYRQSEKKEKENGELWILRIECIWGAYLESEWVRRIEIDSNSSLAELQYHINTMVDFDFDHLFDFYTGRNFRNKKLWFTPTGKFDDEIDYDEIYLSKVFPLPKSLKLYYLFDYGDNWVFEIRRERKKTIRDENVDYPRLLESIGDNPAQYPNYE